MDGHPRIEGAPTPADADQHKAGLNVEGILEGMPEFVCKELLMYMYHDLLAQIPIFRSCSRRFLEQLVLRFRPQVYLPGDFLIREGDVASEMIFLQEGTVTVALCWVSRRM